MRIFSAQGDEVYLKDYEAFEIRNVFTPASITPKLIWPTAGLTPIYYGSEQQFSGLAVEVVFRRKPYENALRLAEVLKKCRLTELRKPELVGKELDCILTGTAVSQEIRNAYAITYQFSCLVYGPERCVWNPGRLYVEGCRPTPAVIEIINASSDTTAKRIGIGTYRIDGMKAGETIRIDGVKKLVSSDKRDGIFSLMDFTAFPALQPGWNDMESNRPPGVDIVVTYRRRW